MNKILKILIIMRFAIVFSFLVLSILFYTNVNAQIYKAYKRLSKPEKHWVLTHPFAAKRTYNISGIVSEEVKKHIKDPELDGDAIGGMVDAFKHTLWMALCSQSVGKKKALSLGFAHEEGNKLEFLGGGGSKYIIQDSVLSRMDILNNEVGALLGEKFKHVDRDSLVLIVKKNVVDGNCYKVKKNNKKRCLDVDGNVIDEQKYQGCWVVPKVIVKSDFKL
ncbi:MAG: hypothetical protein IJ150_11085 [Bacteroidales bacterium]|nr:hypothetical protein [Bacteroidales bacterium]